MDQDQVAVLGDALREGNAQGVRLVAQSMGLVDGGVDKYGLWGAFEVNGMVYRMRWILPGAFVMGSPEDEEGHHDDEKQRAVTIPDGFWLGETPVTQALYRAVTGERPSRFSGGPRPVEQVSWHDAQAFCEQLADRCPGLGARLPSEAEWEYACRAGTTGARYAALDDAAWHYGNSGWQTQPVGVLAPNPWGLHDMFGNVWEWCENAADPDGGSERVIRGGSWFDYARYVRAAYRDACEPGLRYGNLGFRLAADSASR